MAVYLVASSLSPQLSQHVGFKHVLRVFLVFFPVQTLFFSALAIAFVQHRMTPGPFCQTWQHACICGCFRRMKQFLRCFFLSFFPLWFLDISDQKFFRKYICINY